MNSASPADDPSANPLPPQAFVFVICNPRSQAVCKQEISAAQPDWLPSFSRPGFLTYKTPGGLPDRFALPLTFARTWGRSSTPLRSSDSGQIANAGQELAASISAEHIHCWSRDWTDRTSSTSSESDLPDPLQPVLQPLQGLDNIKVNQVAGPDQIVVDLIHVDQGHWWLGWHVAGSIHQRWPGGIPLIKLPERMISRAYLKMTEAIRWSGIPIQKGDVCAEIGSAPGGSCQRLLELGARVFAIDPADLHPDLEKDPNVVHLKMRGRDVPHRQLASVSWLFADSNVAPNHTLDTVEGLVAGKRTRFRGLILTLKFANLKLADDLPGYIQRVRSWGFKYVKTRQLAYGRQEICLVALKQKAVRRFRTPD